MDDERKRQIEAAVEKIRPSLDGMSDADLKWAIGVLRGVVLPHRLDVIDRQPADKRAVLIDHSVNGLVRRLREIPADRKRHEIEAIRFDAILSRIDERAYALAQKRDHGEAAPDDVAEAERLEKELMATVEEFKKWDAGAYREHSDQVSESLLDLKYAISGGKITSHRLSRSGRRSPGGDA